MHATMRPVLYLVVLATVFCGGNAQIRQRKVTIPPLITENPPKRLVFKIGESIELPCFATGEPEPEYYWNLNNEEFSPSGNDGRIARQPGKGTLIFARPIEKDEGFYQCFAYNKHGISTSVVVDMRVAILGSFKSATVRIHRPSLGDSLTLPCTPPQSFPPAEVFWATVSPGEGFQPIDLTDRVSVDPIGNLQFSNVVSGDRKAGSTYTCIAQNTAMRQTQHGAKQEIRPARGEPKRQGPSILWQPPKSQVALRGHTWSVKCIFSGNPTPRVEWTRANGPMPPRRKEGSFGQELIIENVQLEDQGEYECQGINEEQSTPIRRSVELSVEAEPYWERRPETVNAGPGDDAEFFCKGKGRPLVSIAWFINGRPLSTVEADPRRLVSRNTLLIRNLTTDDAMVIQCNVSNKHGYVFANAYINVQTEPPFIQEPPIKNHYVAEGQTVTLRCKVFGSPKPRVVWTKAGEQLTGGRFAQLDSGGLRITDVSLVDAGEYRCTASNRLDEVSDVGNLIVRRKTSIQMPPLDVMVYEGTEAKFTCTATTDPEEIGNLRIDWKKDGQIINYRTAQRVFKNDMDNSLTISGTISLDTGKYSCVASNGLDESEASAQLVVQGRPDAPNNVKVRCYENALPGKAEVEWQAGKENYAPILNFIVQFNTSFAPDTWINVENQVNQTDRKLDVPLSPWGNYTFRVLARNKIGLSPPSEPTRNVCKTLEDVPDKNPDNVIGEGDEPDNLVIYWTPMPKIEQNGPNFKYIITWKRQDLEDAEEQSDTVELTEAYHYVVSEKQPTYKPYSITVKAKNGVGDARVAPKTITGYSGEDTPTVVPLDVEVKPGSVSGTEATLQWSQVDTDPDLVRGFFRGYRIQFWKKREGPNLMREVDFMINEVKQYPRPRNKRDVSDLVEYRLADLPPYSDIELQIRVLNKYYVGPPSEVISLRTKEGAPGPPILFEVVARGSTHFELRWDPPEEKNGELVSYVISYQQITGLNLGRLQYRQPIDNPNQLQARLTGLQPEMDYRVYLAATTGTGQGEPIFLDARTTHAGPPSAPTFEIIDIGENWVQIAWEPSRSGNPGSVFYIQYRARGEYNWMHSRDEVLAFDMKVEMLDPGTTYQARVVSKNGAGNEAPAEWQAFTTGGLGPGRVDLKTAAWFYSIFACLLLILLLLVGFIFMKRFTDTWWEAKEAEIEEQFRQLQAEEAIRQMGIVNQYAQTGSHEMIDASYGDPSGEYFHKGGGYYEEEPEMAEDDDEDGGFAVKQSTALPPGARHVSTDSSRDYSGGDKASGPPSYDKVSYRPPRADYQQQEPRGGSRGSPVEEMRGAYVENGQYHLEQQPQQPGAGGAAPSFV